MRSCVSGQHGCVRTDGLAYFLTPSEPFLKVNIDTLEGVVLSLRAMVTRRRIKEETFPVERLVCRL